MGPVFRCRERPSTSSSCMPVLAYREPQPLLARGLFPQTHDVLLRSHGDGVPLRLVLRVPKIEVVVVDAHSHEVFRARLLVELHQVIGIELVGRPHLADVFVAELRGMAKARDVILILRAALNVDVARIPVAILRDRLRSPMRPDAKLGIAEPLRNLVGLQRLGGSVERPLLDFRTALREGLAREQERGCSRYNADCISSADLHGSTPPERTHGTRPSKANCTTRGRDPQ